MTSLIHRRFLSLSPIIGILLVVISRPCVVVASSSGDLDSGVPPFHLNSLYNLSEYLLDTGYKSHVRPVLNISQVVMGVGTVTFIIVVVVVIIIIIIIIIIIFTIIINISSIIIGSSKFIIIFIVVVVVFVIVAAAVVVSLISHCRHVF